MVDIGDFPDINRHGIISVASDSCIVDMNTVARRLIEAADGLRISDARLQALSPVADRELQSALAKALLRQDSSATSGHVICDRLRGKRPLLLHVVPLRHGHDQVLPSAAIVVVDPDNQVGPPKALLMELFGLTDAEGNVALLMLAGEEAKTIADRLFVSVATVRTHIHRVLQKTGSRRQADLIRKLVALVP